MTAAGLRGGGVQRRLREQLHLASGEVAADNAALVRATREVAALGVLHATCAEARRWFGDART